MRKIVLLILFAFSLSVYSQGQNNPKGHYDFKQIVEKRFDHIAHELNLDNNKVKVLRPLYLEYCKKMGELFKPNTNKKPRDQRTDAEVEADIKDDFCRAKQIVKLRECYYYKLRAHLSAKQIEKIYDIEREEQRKIHQHKDRMKNNQRK